MVHVLIVDDNPDDRENYVRQLGRIADIRYATAEAEGYESMMEQIEKQRPDCVLLDYSLPGRNGLEILRELVANHRYLPVIMMTGQGNEAIAVQSIKDGAQHYLVKSAVTEDALHTHISTAIKHCAMEQDRIDLTRQLIDSNIALERFAYVASHDLQEPIRMINNFGQILLADYQDMLDDDGREYLRMITSSGERMRDMINDLLEYSRLSNETIKFQPFDGNQVLTSALENLHALIEEQQAVITYDELPQLFGSAVQIMRLLQNLIVNAIKYQPKGNIARIHISVQEDEEAWRISVKDNGLGIDDKFLAHIFEPFRRLHTWDTIKGSGLGLSICKKIAENNNGQLTVSSSVGSGSVFTLMLPKQQPLKEAV